MEDNSLKIRFAGVAAPNPEDHQITRSMAARALDLTLWRTAQILQDNGTPVIGALVQQENNNERATEDEIEKMSLKIFPTGQVFNIFVPEKCAAVGCRLDANPFQSVIDTVQNLLQRAPAQTVMVLNRFGKEEAKGRGFGTVLEQAAQRDIPVIIGISNNSARKGGLSLRQAWNTYIEGTSGVLLENNDAAIMKWCRDNHVMKP